MDCNTGKIAFSEKLIELSGSQGALDEDNDLIELERIQEFVEFPVFFSLTQLDVILLQSMQGKFGLTIDEDHSRMLHELLANWANLLGKGSTEHHDLFHSGGGTKDILHITTHVYRSN